MATHSSILAWGIPWTEEPGGLQSIGLQRVGHYRSDLAHTHMLILPALEPYFESHCSKIWFQPTWLKMACVHHADIPTLGEEAKKKR